MRFSPRIIVILLIVFLIIFLVRFFRKGSKRPRVFYERKNPLRPGNEIIDVTYKVTDVRPVGSCPVCKDAVTGASHICPECGVAHHAACWRLNDGCGTCSKKNSGTEA